MSKQGKIRALSATLRLPNLPSVLSNTLTGALLAALIFEQGDLAKLPYALLCATCLYFAGNLFNDWADLSWDRSHRPERALPSGLFKPRTFLIGGILLSALGAALAFVTGMPAFLVSVTLLLFIIIYTWSHKRTAFSVLPMACCRAMLPLLGYSACSSNLNKLEWIAAPATLLFIYLIMLSLRARSESRTQSAGKGSLITALGLMSPPVLLAAYWYFPHFWTDALLACLAGGIPYTIWIALTLTIFRKPISRQVSAMLAGIPLVDGLFLLPYLIMGTVLLPDALSQGLAYFWVVAFLLGCLLQRYVPAT